MRAVWLSNNLCSPGVLGSTSGHPSVDCGPFDIHQRPAIHGSAFTSNWRVDSPSPISSEERLRYLWMSSQHYSPYRTLHVSLRSRFVILYAKLRSLIYIFILYLSNLHAAYKILAWILLARKCTFQHPTAAIVQDVHKTFCNISTLFLILC